MGIAKDVLSETQPKKARVYPPASLNPVGSHLLPPSLSTMVGK
jgi:hypothetical protein